MKFCVFHLITGRNLQGTFSEDDLTEQIFQVCECSVIVPP